MTPQQSPLPQIHKPLGGLPLSCALLVAVLALAALPVAAWNFNQYGSLGFASAAIAMLLCLAGALAALMISAQFAPTPHALSANLGAMFVRMGVPLFGVVVLPNLLPEMAAVGLSHSIVILYLVGLAAETSLALRHVVPGVRKQSPGNPSPNSNPQSAIRN